MITKLGLFSFLGICFLISQKTLAAGFSLSYLSQSVGALTNQKVGGGSCTTFKIGSKLMVTNSHCMESQDDCDHTYITFFDQQDQAVSRVRCLKFLGAAPRTKKTDEPDVALFELENPMCTIPNIPIRKESMNAFNQVEKLQIIKTSFATITEGNRPPERNFEVCYGSLEDNGKLFNILPEYKILPENENTVCKLRLGNSGSPILDSNGYLVGIFSYIKIAKPQANGDNISIDQLNIFNLEKLGGTSLNFMRSFFGAKLDPADECWN